MGSTKGSGKKVRKTINICANIFIIKTFCLLKERTDLSLYNKTSIIIISSLSIRRMID